MDKYRTKKDMYNNKQNMYKIKIGQFFKINKKYHFYKLFFKNQKWTFINVQIPFLKKNPENKKS